MNKNYDIKWVSVFEEFIKNKIKTPVFIRTFPIKSRSKNIYMQYAEAIF